METVRIFIGTTKSGNKKGSYAIGVGAHDEYMMLPAVSISSQSPMTQEKLILNAVLDFLQRFLSVKQRQRPELHFYIQNDKLVYEWNEEYLKTGKITAEREEADLWRSILALTRANHLNVAFSGTDSPLNALTKLERNRAKKQ